MESRLNKAEAIGSSTRAVLDIAGVYDKDILETACSLALKDFVNPLR